MIPYIIAGAVIALMGLLAGWGETLQIRWEDRRLSRHTCHVDASSPAGVGAGVETGCSGYTRSPAALCVALSSWTILRDSTGPTARGGCSYGESFPVRRK